LRKGHRFMTSQGRGQVHLSSGPCILFAVVESARRARQTDLGPGPLIEKTAKKSKGRLALLF
jgi:hypothetical protein